VVSPIKTIVFWLVIGLSALLLWQVVKSGSQSTALPEISYSQFMSDVEAGDVARVTISGDRARAEYRTPGKTVRVVVPQSQNAMLEALRSKGAEIWFKDSGNESSTSLQLLGTWAPLILLGLLWLYMMRQMRKSPSTRPRAISPGPGTGLDNSV